MTAWEVLDSGFRHFVLVKRAGENIELEILFPEDFPIPADLIRQVRAHKDEIFHLLAWEEQADALILDSTRRLAAAWPSECPLLGPEWETHEAELQDGYRSMDLCRLTTAIKSREDLALSVFDAYRKKVIR